MTEWPQILEKHKRDVLGVEKFGVDFEDSWPRELLEHRRVEHWRTYPVERKDFPEKNLIIIEAKIMVYMEVYTYNKLTKEENRYWSNGYNYHHSKEIAIKTNGDNRHIEVRVICGDIDEELPYHAVA